MTAMTMVADAQLKQFHDEGYVVVDDVLPPDAVAALADEIDDVVANTARRLFDEGKITDLRENEGFRTRLAGLIDDHPELASTYYGALEGRAGGGHTGPAMFAALTHPRLLDAMEMLLGPEILGSSVYRIRPKLPGKNRGVVPWHQDSGYYSPHCDTTLIVTCWIPLVDANEANGCLQVIPRTHRDGVIEHRTGGNAGFLQIPDQALPSDDRSPITVPVRAGGALLMTNLTPHQSLWNGSDHIRWSIDLRYQSADSPNNAFQEPEDFNPNAEPYQIACYPPEGDFVVRSKARPESVTSYEEFQRRRLRYEAVGLPGPNRGWVPFQS
jgi:ectoine hydroxylase-related dioxygenase (phytanoyl-CoA dioxygenase family)